MPKKKSRLTERPVVVKRRGHNESFDERKVYASCYLACVTSHLLPKEAEKICENVVRDVKRSLKGKKNIDSQHIFEAVARFLRKHNEDAAFMYATHRDIS